MGPWNHGAGGLLLLCARSGPRGAHAHGPGHSRAAGQQGRPRAAGTDADPHRGKGDRGERNIRDIRIENEGECLSRANGEPQNIILKGSLCRGRVVL